MRFCGRTELRSVTGYTPHARRVEARREVDDVVPRIIELGPLEEAAVDDQDQIVSGDLGHGSDGASAARSMTAVRYRRVPDPPSGSRSPRRSAAKS